MVSRRTSRPVLLRVMLLPLLLSALVLLPSIGLPNQAQASDWVPPTLLLNLVGVIGDGFNSPSGIAVDGAWNVYVADSSDNRIEKFNASGTFLGAWGSYGSAEGKFRGPRGVAVDDAWNVYVADSSNNRI